ncbi:MAG: response regulator [Pseudomonadota bacterium]
MPKKQASIMVVDGSGVSRTLITRILRIEMADAVVTACASAQQALSYLESGRYDLITTSLTLPDMDGLDLCRHIRRSATHCFTPVIVVASDANERLLREGYAAGVTDYFDRSHGYADLVEFIKALSLRKLGQVGKILYVEDSPTAAEITRRIMEKQGLEVLHMPSAQEALGYLQRASPEEARQFDIVVTDFFLQGGMNGADLLRALRLTHHYSHHELPVLVTTADNSERRHLEVLQAGGNDVVTKPIVEEIFIARLHSLLLIKQQYSALLRQAEEIRRLATTDSLTGVRSKRYLLDGGERFLANSDNNPVSAFLIDVDHLKKINDDLGHITGDHILIRLGAMLRQHFGEDSIVVRFGGEEFAILIPRCPAAEAGIQAETLRRNAEALCPVQIPITVSVGVACSADHPGANLTRLLALADKALYTAKNAGRNRVYLFTAQHGAQPFESPDKPFVAESAALYQ